MKDDANSSRTTVYTSDSIVRAPGRLIGNMFADLAAARELGMLLAVRDISALYRQTALGLMWAFLLPVTHAAVWIFLNANGIVDVLDPTIPYPVYVLSGTILWAIFSEATNAPLKQTGAARTMLSKFNFPREALILSGIYQSAFNAAIRVLVLIPALVLFGLSPDWHLLLLPAGVFVLILAGTAIGLALVPIGLLYKDVGKSLPLVLQFLMYLTPVVYALPASGTARDVFEMNPLTPLILTTRNWATGLPSEHLPQFIAIMLGSLILLALSWVVFRAAMPILIERMSA